MGEVEPELGQKEATGHGSQLVAFSLGWYLPGSHSVHVAKPGPAAQVPGLQVAGTVAPVMHMEPRGQAEHSAAEARPVVPLKVPSLQGSGADAPSSQYAPGGHTKHWLLLPLMFMNLPASHLSQVPCPAAGCTVPGLHSVGSAAPVEQKAPTGHAKQSPTLVITASDAF